MLPNVTVQCSRGSTQGFEVVRPTSRALSLPAPLRAFYEPAPPKSPPGTHTMVLTVELRAPGGGEGAKMGVAMAAIARLNSNSTNRAARIGCGPGHRTSDWKLGG
jgi:hypothetical protein